MQRCIGAKIPESPALENVASLFTSVIAIGDETSSLADRRQACLHAVARLAGADAGFWAWGRGWPDRSSVTALAMIDFGFTDEQRMIIATWALDREATQSFHARIVERVRRSLQATSLPEDVYTKHEWDAVPPMRRELTRASFDSWLHAVRYSSGDTWSNFFLVRNLGCPEFTRQDADIVDFALANVSWLHSTAAEADALPPDLFVGLTPRQRTVMLMLLDGLSRKKIAGLLGISEDTIGDHVKAIYAHFGVGSVSELAALFLRGK
jgi:DNA-binding CsgD family transcriptional regulator